MITSTLSIILGVFAALGLLVTIALFVKVIRVNSEEFRELRRFQGKEKNVINGTLRNSPDEFGDFRIVKGLSFDPIKRQYEPQSALSSEGLKAAFPN